MAVTMAGREEEEDEDSFEYSADFDDGHYY